MIITFITDKFYLHPPGELWQRGLLHDEDLGDDDRRVRVRRPLLRQRQQRRGRGNAAISGEDGRPRLRAGLETEICLILPPQNL